MKRSARSSMGRDSLFRSACLFLAVGACGTLGAQNAVLSISSAEVIPGGKFALSLRAQITQPIRGFQVGIEYPAHAMRLEKISFEDTAIDRKPLEVFNSFLTASGFATLQVLLDNTPPFSNDIPSGTAVRLARLEFRMTQGLRPGDEFPVVLKSNLGIPPLPALVYSGSQAVAPVSMLAGIVKVINVNYIKIKDLNGVQAGQKVSLDFTAFNIDPLQGFSLAVKFDPAKVRFLNADISDTITEAVGAEYVAPIIDNARGTFVLGVLLDTLPPFLNQVIPASGLSYTLARVEVQVLSTIRPDEAIDFTFADGTGEPPIRNVFIVNNQGVEPRKENGRLTLLREAPFLRGDANEDGEVDISDPIKTVEWIFLKGQSPRCEKAADSNDNGKVDIADILYTLNYLFDRGPIIPAPYPAAGQDPSADDLLCPF